MANPFMVSVDVHPRTNISEQFRLLEQAFAGYFRPHTAALAVIKQMPKEPYLTTFAIPHLVKGIGGIHEWKNLSLSLLDMYLFPYSVSNLLLPNENINTEHQWTNIELPDCSQVIHDWLNSYQAAYQWRISVAGDTNVMLETDGSIASHSVFRQVLPSVSKNANSGEAIPCQYESIVNIQCVSGQPVGEDNALIYIGTGSNLWLEQSGAFGGRARYTVNENIENLANSISAFVTELGDSADEVYWYAPEGTVWKREADRIWKAFQRIPKIEIG